MHFLCVYFDLSIELLDRVKCIGKLLGVWRVCVDVLKVYIKVGEQIGEG